MHVSSPCFLTELQYSYRRKGGWGWHPRSRFRLAVMRGREPGRGEWDIPELESQRGAIAAIQWSQKISACWP